MPTRTWELVCPHLLKVGIFTISADYRLGRRICLNCRDELCIGDIENSANIIRWMQKETMIKLTVLLRAMGFSCEEIGGILGVNSKTAQDYWAKRVRLDGDFNFYSHLGETLKPFREILLNERGKG